MTATHETMTALVDALAKMARAAREVEYAAAELRVLLDFEVEVDGERCHASELLAANRDNGELQAALIELLIAEPGAEEEIDLGDGAEVKLTRVGS